MDEGNKNEDGEQGVESPDGKFDQVISVDDLFPIKLRKPSKPVDDDIDAKHDTPPPLPVKTRNDIVPAFREPETQVEQLTAGSVLGVDPVWSDEDQEICMAEGFVNRSESIKAFFGSASDTVDAGRETIPSYEYDMTHEHRGCFVIFNHMNFQPHLNVNSRKGTDEDKKNLEKMAKKLGFEYIKTFDDLGVHDIIKWVKKIGASDHSKYDCFGMAILTHGDEGDILYAHDAKYHIDAITDPFLARNCPSLAGKPKMLFIQACRGVMLDDGAGVASKGDTVDAKIDQVANKTEKDIMIIPNAADFMLGFSTVPGYYAWRNQACGSWFIQALCKCLTEFSEKLELMQIMTRVNRMVAYDFISYSKQNQHFHGKKQIPSIVTRLTAEVFFRKKGKKRCPSPLRAKHRLPILEKRKQSPDGKTEQDENEQKLASLKETHL